MTEPTKAQKALKVTGNIASACCLLSTDVLVTLLSKSAQKVTDAIDRMCDSGHNTARKKVAWHEQRYSTTPVYFTRSFRSGEGQPNFWTQMSIAFNTGASTKDTEKESSDTVKGTYDELDVEACLRNSTYPIKHDQLILKAKEIMAMDYGTKEGCDPSQYLAEDFQFVAPIIGPLSKDEFLRAFGSFKVRDAIPDGKDNAWFSVDPLEPNRVWFVSRMTATHTGPLNFGAKPLPATGKTINCPPQAQSMLFDDQGKCYTLTVGYTMDKRIGNTDGLGGMFGIVKATGNALPFPEAQRLYNPSLRFEGFERIAKAVETCGYDPNTMKPIPRVKQDLAVASASQDEPLKGA